MHDGKCAHWVDGAVAGLLGGLVASWVMNEFMARAGPKVQQLAEAIAGPGPSAKESGNAEGQDSA